MALYLVQGKTIVNLDSQASDESIELDSFLELTQLAEDSEFLLGDPYCFCCIQETVALSQNELETIGQNHFRFFEAPSSRYFISSFPLPNKRMLLINTYLTDEGQKFLDRLTNKIHFRPFLSWLIERLTCQKHFAEKNMLFLLPEGALYFSGQTSVFKYWRDWSPQSSSRVKEFRIKTLLLPPAIDSYETIGPQAMSWRNFFTQVGKRRFPSFQKKQRRGSFFFLKQWPKVYFSLLPTLAGLFSVFTLALLIFGEVQQSTHRRELYGLQKRLKQEQILLQAFAPLLNKEQTNFLSKEELNQKYEENLPFLMEIMKQWIAEHSWIAGVTRSNEETIIRLISPKVNISGERLRILQKNLPGFSIALIHQESFSISDQILYEHSLRISRQ